MRLAAPWGCLVDTKLSGRTILIVEDEPLIAIDISDTFKRAGASPAVAHCLAVARKLVEDDGICAAIVDFGLSDSDANELCRLLHQNGVPFVLHSGYAHPRLAFAPAAAIPKPAHPKTLVEAVCKLLEAK
jgi:DNA-binding response OmpR family regulator